MRSAPVLPMFSSSNPQNARGNTLPTITKAAFVADLAETHNMNRQNAQEAVNAVVATLTQTLIDGHGIKLPGLGTFSLKERAGRTGRNPQLPGKASRSRLNARPSSKWPAIYNDRSISRNDLMRQNDAFGLVIVAEQFLIGRSTNAHATPNKT